MATVKQYTANLWKAHKVVCRKLGMDVSWGDPGERVRVVSSDVMLAGLLKILVDKGVISDADLTAAYTAITNATFPVLPPVGYPNFAEGDVAADPDLGG